MTQPIFILDEGKEKLIEYKELLERLTVDGVIRIPKTEFSLIDLTSTLYGHFNIEKTNHKVGTTYALLPIERDGRYASASTPEELPLLSLENCIIAECIHIENHIPYAALTPSYFKHSMKNISDIESLKAFILKRYGPPRSELTANELLAKGVAFTLLRLVK